MAAATTDDDAALKSLRQFLQAHECYDLMPVSGRQLALDSRLPVKKAYLAVVQHDTEVAPVWRTSTSDSPAQFIGALTTHHFLLLLQQLYRANTEAGSGASIHDILARLDAMTIADLLTLDEDASRVPRGYSCIAPEQDLLEAARLLVKDRTHTIILTDPVMGAAAQSAVAHQLGAVLSTFYSYRLVQFIAVNYSQVNTLKATVECIGSFKNLVVASPDSTVIQLVSQFIGHRVHAIPIVDADGCLLDVFERADIIRWIFDGLSTERLLDCTVQDVLGSFPTNSRMHVCASTATFADVLNAIMLNESARTILFTDSLSQR